MKIGKVKSSSEFVSEFVKEIDRIAGLNGLSYFDAVMQEAESKPVFDRGRSTDKFKNLKV